MFPPRSPITGGRSSAHLRTTGQANTTGERRRLQLKADSSTLLSCPKNGLMGQFFHLKTLHSYSKCTQVPVSPRQQKDEDDLVVVRATPLCPSEMFKLTLEKQQRKEEKKLRELQNLQSAFEGDGIYSPGSSVGSKSRRRLQPISGTNHSGRRGRRKTKGCSSPIDKNQYNKPRNISPLKKETGLEEMTVHEARYKYKQTYPADHPPVIMKKL